MGRTREHYLAILCLLTGICGCHDGGKDRAQTVDPGERLIRMLERLPTVEAIHRWELPGYITQKTATHLVVTTRHYEIYTTLSDPLILRQTPVFMESAFHSYAEVIGKSIATPRKLKVVFLQTRGQWEDYTRHLAGEKAGTFLKIPAGAYYYQGECVAYNLSRSANFSILAHEGWHQFSESLFTCRLPAWLDEGLATQFEAYSWADGRVVFRPAFNGSRLYSLRQGIAGEMLFPIDDLLALDAGRVISLTTYTPDSAAVHPRVAAYYAQVYALVRFLREYHYGYYRQALQTMLQDAYTGQWPLEENYRAEARQRDRNPSRLWNAAVGRFLFRHYVADVPGELEDAYQAFCFKIQAPVRVKQGQGSAASARGLENRSGGTGIRLPIENARFLQ